MRQRLGEVTDDMREETMAEVVTRLLAERELTLGTIECGVNGMVSRQIFDAPDGPVALGSSLIVDDVEEAIGVLNLPRPQFEKAGNFSAKAARAAARQGRAFLGVDLCLAVWGRASWDTAPIADDSGARQSIHVALDTGQKVVVQTFRVGGQSERARDELVNQALDMVRRALL